MSVLNVALIKKSRDLFGGGIDAIEEEFGLAGLDHLAWIIERRRARLIRFSETERDQMFDLA